MYFYLIHFRSKTTFTMSMYTQIKFNGKIVQKLFILKLEPDLDPEPEKLYEFIKRIMLILLLW